MNRYLAAILLWTFFAAACSAADFAVVVNKANRSETLSANDLRQIFLGKKTAWPDSKPVVFILQEDSAVHEAFLRKIVKKSPQQFLLYWKKALFTGKGGVPHEVPGDREVKEYVASNPSAVGYISKDAVDDSIKVLEITE